MTSQPLHLDAPTIWLEDIPSWAKTVVLDVIRVGRRGVGAGVSFLFIYLKFRCRTGVQRGLLATFGHIWSHGTSDHKGPLHHSLKHPVNTLFKKGRYGRLETLPPCQRAAHVCTSTPYQVMPPNSKLAMFNSGQSWGGDLRNVSSPRKQDVTLILLDSVLWRRIYGYMYPH